MEKSVMYDYSVPINNRNFAKDDREAIVKLLEEMGIKRVLFPIGCYHFDEKERKEEFEILKSNCAFMKERGFEVGTWLWTFMDTRSQSEYTRMRFLSGEESGQSVCPSDEKFRAFAKEYICDLAKCGVDFRVRAYIE